MRRPAAQEKTLERIRRWREICPDIAIRSTFIVGFPGETEADFDELLAWLDEAKLDRVGCFRFEPVAGAPANALPDPVPDEVKDQRWHRLMQAQQAISARKLQKKVGAPRAGHRRRERRQDRPRAARSGTRRRSTAPCI